MTMKMQNVNKGLRSFVNNFWHLEKQSNNNNVALFPPHLNSSNVSPDGEKKNSVRRNKKKEANFSIFFFHFSDDKILTAWNGLMISGFSVSGMALRKLAHTERAIKAAKFVKEHLYDANTKVSRRYLFSRNNGVKIKMIFLEKLKWGNFSVKQSNSVVRTQ